MPEIQMTDASTLLADLRRPRLLIRAARFGLVDYDRTRDLKRLLGLTVPPSPSVAVERLIEEEAAHEERRRAGGLGYSPTRHVDVLIALIAEVRLVAQHATAPEVPGKPQAKASGIPAFFSATKASSASRVPGSSGGAS